MATKPIIGYVTVGGARKEISGGYVNIGGVWKPIVKTYVNVNGVWKNAWKELYTWKKYTVKKSSTYAQSKSSLKTNSSHDFSEAVKYSSSYTFDSSTGKYTLKSPSTGDCYDLTTTNKYYMTGTSTSGSTMDEYSSKGFIISGIGTLKYYTHSSTVTSTTETIGTYISDVTSENSSAYPTNGKHTDGYWYVKQ